MDPVQRMFAQVLGTQPLTIAATREHFMVRHSARACDGSSCTGLPTIAFCWGDSNTAILRAGR